MRLLWLSLAVILLNGVGVLLFMLDMRLPFAMLAAVVGVLVAVKNPLAGVALVLAGRLTSTGANAWVRIGSINLDLFEPALLLALGALLVHTMSTRDLHLPDVPWRLPVLIFLAYQVVSLTWTTNFTEAIQEVMATLILLTTTFVILAFVRSWQQLRGILLVWIGVSFMIGFLAALGMGAPSETSQFEMAQGNRSGGFGQHPNWFAMNLMYSVTVAFALGFIEKSKNRRWGFYAVGVAIFLFQMASGSRGGTGAIAIGAIVAGLFHPGLRSTMVKWGGIGLALVSLVILSDTGAFTTAFSRIWVDSGTMLGASVRESNWVVCWQMLGDTMGRGIGGGGYEDLLANYNTWLYNSIYRYPHGIFWGMMAHYGVVGMTLWAWFLAIIVRMTLQAVNWTKGHDLQAVILAMFGAMVGYFAWSFFEFMYDDKPFWEFLGLYTVLWGLAKQIGTTAKESETDVPLETKAVS